MGLFSKDEPVILKEGSSAYEHLATLEALRDVVPSNLKRSLEEDIRNVRAGIAGEERILFELKNSHTDMYVLQDLYLEYEGLSAQIDFLVITSQRNFILECKNLYGDIEVNARGEFIRSTRRGKRESIYSPITQNQRHIDLIHKMRRNKRNLLTNLIMDKDFDDAYRNLVVLANPRSILNDRYAKKEVKQHLVRVDHLIETIKRINAEPGAAHTKAFANATRELAEWFLANDGENPVNYCEKYIAQTNAPEIEEHPIENIVAPCEESKNNSTGNIETKEMPCPKCGAPMVLRTASRGKHAGEQFYGCSKFPSCWGTVKLEKENE